MEAPEAPAPPFTFTASGTGYFRIWVVNTALTILTLGFYHPWALVRKRQYFYGHTHFQGETFSFLGRPLPILWGYLLILTLTAVIQIGNILANTNKLWLILVVGGALLWVVLLPVFVRMSIRFRASTALWNGLRFGHTVTLGQSYGIFLWRTFLIYLTLGFYLPAWDLRRAALLFGGLKWGNLPFAFSAKLKDYWIAYLILWGVSAMVATVFFGAIMAGVVAKVLVEQSGGEKKSDSGKSGDLGVTDWAIMAILVVAYLVVIFVVSALWKSLLFKTNWNAVSVGPAKFGCRLSIPKYMLRSVVWVGLTFLTLGFYRPWAQVAQTRMLLESLTLTGDEGEIRTCLDQARSEQGTQGGAVGEVAVENAGFEVGF